MSVYIAMFYDLRRMASKQRHDYLMSTKEIPNHHRIEMFIEHIRENRRSLITGFNQDERLRSKYELIEVVGDAYTALAMRTMRDFKGQLLESKKKKLEVLIKRFMDEMEKINPAELANLVIQKSS